ncbi:CoA pyrophosphatase [Roseivivax isoporae]|uniref:DNA mismatch repair protein MutT n=1 Tax=Roseivivax isoporae LMG 25204 TaxID=1449351 RepID=X7FA98_9RHOB|nr:CoA pyrophosphatase [Roseivivax isoporae]ETX29628.1 DNA mismatch repair protein MutT [Roseivivax isoporae LMG 25204]
MSTAETRGPGPAGPDLLDRLATALRQPAGDTSDFDLNPGVALPPGRKLRPAGVLVPLLEDGDTVRLILTKRSSRLKHHPGQIAFPGGKQDEGDPDVTAAALREAEEEIGLSRADVRVLGHLPAHETVTGFLMTPVIGVVAPGFVAVPEPGEVDEVFTVPFAHVTDPARFAVEGRRWRGSRRHYYTVPYGPYYIWGATARVLRALAARLHP